MTCEQKDSIHVEDLDEFKKLQNKIKHIWDENPAENVYNIKRSLEAAFSFACQITAVHYPLDKEGLGRLCEALVRITTAEFIKQWFLHDKNISKNINSFSNDKYTKIEKKRYHTPSSNSSIALSQMLRRQYKKRIALKELNVKQAEAEGRLVRRPSDKSTSNASDGKRGSVPVHFSNLWYIEKMSTGELRILDLLYGKKELLSVTQEKGKNDSLCTACKSYYSIYRSLIPVQKRADVRISNETPVLENSEYTITAILMYALESELRIHATIMLAKHIKDNSLKINFDDYTDQILCTWGRFADIEENGIRKINPPNRIFEYISYDVLHVPDEISFILDHSLSAKRSMTLHLKNIAVERAMLLLMDKIMPTFSIHSWTEKDYQDARHFFETDYPLYQNYIDICNRHGEFDLGEVNSETHDTCYDYIREFAQWFIDTSKKHAYNSEAPGRKEIYETLRKSRSRKDKAERDS